MADNVKSFEAKVEEVQEQYKDKPVTKGLEDLPGTEIKMFATDFNQLDMQMETYDVASDIMKLANQFLDITYSNVDMHLYAHAAEDMSPEELKSSMLLVAGQLTQRINEIDISGSNQKSLDYPPILYNHDDQNFGVKSSLLDNGDIVYRWSGIVSNAYQDKHDEWISEVAHQTFVKELVDGTLDYPPLMYAHNGIVLGTTDFVTYDSETGVLAASGLLLPEFLPFVSSALHSSSYKMSHGFLKRDTVRDKDDSRIITRYKSREFTFLRDGHEANALTTFTANIA